MLQNKIHETSMVKVLPPKGMTNMDVPCDK